VDRSADVVAIYDDALPCVYGYLRSRCGDARLAEDLTSEAFLGALGQARRGVVDEVTTAWLIGIARHKLIDHWRRAATRPSPDDLDRIDDSSVADDPWDVVIDRWRVDEVLAGLGPHHRSALTLRYLDGLPVPEVAGHLDRTVDATEALLVRARRAFRSGYERTGGS
jgi:RNA polymerase sigma-70 factor (ECF subfamily)